MRKSITQDMAYRQSLMKYAEKYGVSRASRKYNKSRSYIYFWRARWDGSVESLACQSRRPHSHPKLAEFTELSVKERQGDPIELTKLKVRADEIEKEIATLIDKIVSASPATMEYINERIDALDEEKENVREQIAQMSAEMYGKRNMETISGYINDWERIDMDDKLTVVDALIDNIRVGRGDVQITWKI